MRDLASIQADNDPVTRAARELRRRPISTPCGWDQYSTDERIRFVQAQGGIPRIGRYMAPGLEQVMEEEHPEEPKILRAAANVCGGIHLTTLVSEMREGFAYGVERIEGDTAYVLVFRSSCRCPHCGHVARQNKRLDPVSAGI